MESTPPTITRKALLIGINYRGTIAELKGCINDVHHVRDFLLAHGYVAENITIITEDTPVKPTRRNIIDALHNLLATNAEHLFFHYSGHGSWVKDTNGDESDRRDECLVPLDYKQAGMISDDQLSGLFTFMNPKSKMIAILDCCHSGTALDLCYTLTNVRRMIRVGRKRIPRNEMIMQKQGKYKDTPGQVVMVSGCLDVQTAADAFINREAQGALTACLLECLGQPEQNKTWLNLITNLRQLLKKSKFTQIANLTSGKPLGLNEQIAF